MEYSKPVILAQGKAAGSYAAMCPANNSCNGGAVNGGGASCRWCERTK